MVSTKLYTSQLALKETTQFYPKNNIHLINYIYNICTKWLKSVVELPTKLCSSNLYTITYYTWLCLLN